MQHIFPILSNSKRDKMEKVRYLNTPVFEFVQIGGRFWTMSSKVFIPSYFNTFFVSNLFSCSLNWDGPKCVYVRAVRIDTWNTTGTKDAAFWHLSRRQNFRIRIFIIKSTDSEVTIYHVKTRNSSWNTNLTT